VARPENGLHLETQGKVSEMASLLTAKRKPAGSTFPSRETRRCPMVRYRAAWCRGLCQPYDGVGQCGFDAPHASLGRTQRAIAAAQEQIITIMRR